MLILIWFLLGLFFGSFVNALVWRVHEQSGKKKKHPELSIVNGRSMCTHCKHQLAWYDLIPLFSWLSLAGKCRYCRKPIGWQYPVVELTLAVLFAVSYLLIPDTTQSDLLTGFQFAAWLVILTGFLALIIYDFRWMLLPNRIVYPLIVVAGVLASVNIIFGGGWSLLLATIYSVIIAGGIFFLLFQLSGGRWIGGGDVNLGVIIGLLLQNPLQAFLVLLLASCIGTVVILPGLMLKKITTKSRIPFGPFLIIATIFVYLVGESLIEWYKRSVLGF